ncbi:hypothetical protein [Candidatus Electronema sp. TJ]|uniref:hypothetical protein n=1 Tax=Candidatus Electronema sp. TJ TaxID=3401573 RepID=UPI003AA91D8A
MLLDKVAQCAAPMLLSFTLAIFWQTQAAAFDLSAPRGQKTVRHSLNEVCIIPKNFPLSANQKADKKQEEMCGWDFYADARKIKLEAKNNSTNPAVIVSVFDQGKGEFAREAKLKSSVTCSYAPAILAYYQLSRYLGGAGNVPEAVLRTMNLAKHKKIREAGRTSSIASMWASWDKYYRELSPSVFTNDKKQIYGALTDIAKQERFFSEIYGSPSARTPEARLAAFRATAVYKAMTNSAPLASLIPARVDIQLVAKPNIGSVTQDDKLRRTVQWTQYVRDLADMVLLDSLLNQQDRFGNQHKKAFIYQFVEGGKIKKHKVKAAKNRQGKALGWSIGAEEKALLEQGGVLIEEMLLKDNDCGGSRKTNVQMSAGTAEKIRHVHPESYFRLVKLNAALRQEQDLPASQRTLERYFSNELLFTDNDLRMFRSNLEKTAAAMRKNCKAGLLKLDADILVQLGKKPMPASCEPD